MNAQAQDTVETPVSAALLTALRNHAQAVIASGKLKGKQGQRWALKAQQTWEALKALGVTDDIGLALSPAQQQAADSIFDTEYDRWEALAAKVKARLRRQTETTSTTRFLVKKRKTRRAQPLPRAA